MAEDRRLNDDKVPSIPPIPTNQQISDRTDWKPTSGPVGQPSSPSFFGRVTATLGSAYRRWKAYISGANS